MVVSLALEDKINNATLPSHRALRFLITYDCIHTDKHYINAKGREKKDYFSFC